MGEVELNGFFEFETPNKEAMRTQGTVEHISADALDKGNAVAYKKLISEGSCSYFEEYGCYADDEDDEDGDCCCD